MIASLSEKAEITCIINVRNGEEYLKHTILSVDKQSIPVHLLLIDNQSTDETAKISQEFSKLRYVKTPHSMKLSEARNYSLQFVETPFVSWLDADDLWLPKFCEESVQALLSDSNAGLVNSCTILIGPDGNELPENKQRMRRTESKSIREGDTLEKVFEKLRCEASWQSYVFKTELVRKVGGFKLHFDFSADLDLITRCLLESKCLHIEEDLSLCRVHPKQLTQKFTPQMRFNETKEVILFAANKLEIYKSKKKLNKLLEIIDFRSNLACFLELKSLKHALKAFQLLLKPHVSHWLSKKLLSRGSY